jgi:hypothetical protein
LRAIETLLIAGLREWLTWESGAKNVVRGDTRETNRANIAMRAYAEVSLIQVRQVSIEFGGKDASMTQRGQGLVESTEPGI